MGTSLSADALKIFVSDLAHLSDYRIRRSLERVRREVRGSNGFAPRLTLQDVLDRAGIVTEGEAREMEAEQDWQFAVALAARHAREDASGDVTLQRIVSKPLSTCENCSGEGWIHLAANGVRSVKECSCKTVTPIPEVSDRILAAVRQLGGWGILKSVADKNYPFVRRDFLAAYKLEVKAEDWNQDSRASKKLAVGTTSSSQREELLNQILASPVR